MENTTKTFAELNAEFREKWEKMQENLLMQRTCLFVTKDIQDNGIAKINKLKGK